MKNQCERFSFQDEMGSRMPRAKRSIQATVTIDGFPLIWRLHREQQWFTADGWKGIAIHVCVADKVRREIFLEFPPVGTEKAGVSKDAPPRHPILPAVIEAGIRKAMAAGWDPASRGQPYFYQVDELPG
jgi:hypothetical protein